jgi:protein phosphatase
MPWSAKAQELLRSQYAAVGAAGSASLPAAIQALERAASHLVGEERNRLAALEESYSVQASNVERFVSAYRRYCWPVAGVSDLKLAPFHLLATEGKTYFDRSHVWHMETIAEICRADAVVLLATRWRTVDLAAPESEEAAARWWRDLTAAGGEGMVVKPIDFVAARGGRTVQPAVKCRGPEYLRIIYGPDYDMPENLQRLRSRGLGRKRSLAMREFALGVESLERFVAREPLRRVHECGFATLALESEPVDPRL